MTPPVYGPARDVMRVWPAQMPQPVQRSPVQRRAARVPPMRFNPQAWRDREAGKTIYVWGGGWSLPKTPAAELAGAVNIATNHQVWAAKRLRFPMPDYWIWYDAVVCHDVAIDAYPEPQKLIMETPARMLIKRGFRQVNEPEGGRGETLLISSVVGGQPMPESSGLVMGTSTLYGAIHLAWILGGNPIHVRGLDGGPHPVTGQVHWWSPAVDSAGVARAYRRQWEDFITLLARIHASGIRITVGPDCAFGSRLPTGIVAEGA